MPVDYAEAKAFWEKFPITAHPSSNSLIDVGRRVDEFWKSNPNGSIADALIYAAQPKTVTTSEIDLAQLTYEDQGEIRMVSSTGAEKGSKVERYDLIPAEPLRLLAQHFGRGAMKYEDRNWEAGYEWSLSFAALMRHAWAFWGGEDLDPETGTPHIIAAAWHAFALTEYMNTHPEFDNRPTTLERKKDLGETA